VYDSDVATKPRVKQAERRLASALIKIGNEAYSVLLPQTPGGQKQGADDFLKAKGNAAFSKLVKAATLVAPAEPLRGQIRLVVLRGSDVEMEPTEFLWKPYIPKSKLLGIKGDPGGGKTTLLLTIAATFSRGCVPDSSDKCEPLNTLYFSNENDPESQVLPRFIAAGGDVDRLFIVSGAIDEDGMPRSFSLADTGPLEDQIREWKIGLAIFDPLQSYLGPKVDMHRANETRPILDGLTAVAKRTGATMIIVRHMAKNTSGRSTNSGLGSVDIIGAIRSELLVGKSPDEPGHWAMIHDKTNVGRAGDSLRFAIVTEVLKSKKGQDIETAKLEWRGKSDLTSADLRAPEGAKDKNLPERARQWLLAALSKGPRLATQLFDDWAAESGQNPQTAERTLQNASKALRLAKNKGGNGKHGPMMWQLPPVKKFAAGYVAKEGPDSDGDVRGGPS